MLVQRTTTLLHNQNLAELHSEEFVLNYRNLHPHVQVEFKASNPQEHKEFEELKNKTNSLIPADSATDHATNNSQGFPRYNVPELLPAEEAPECHHLHGWCLRPRSQCIISHRSSNHSNCRANQGRRRECSHLLEHLLRRRPESDNPLYKMRS
ncbi:hypothetical protein Mapa_007957 [Marchantia paleacea]|nr:hypothetical protein Mapa_007957 [Marchantia paleacea]